MHRSIPLAKLGTRGFVAALRRCYLHPSSLRAWCRHVGVRPDVSAITRPMPGVVLRRDVFVARCLRASVASLPSALETPSHVLCHGAAGARASAWPDGR